MNPKERRIQQERAKLLLQLAELIDCEESIVVKAVTVTDALTSMAVAMLHEATVPPKVSP